MRSSIPDFSSVIRSLEDLFERVYSLVGKHTRLASGLISLSSAGWNSEHGDEFILCKQSLENQVTLAHAHVDNSKRLWVYTDASDYFWSGKSYIFRLPVPGSHGLANAMTRLRFCPVTSQNIPCFGRPSKNSRMR